MKPTKTSSLVCLSAVLQCIHPTTAAAASPLVDLGYTAVQGTQNASTGCVQLKPSKSSVYTYLTACTGSTLFWGSHTLLRLWATFAGTMMSNVLVGMATIDMSSRRAPVPIELETPHLSARPSMQLHKVQHACKASQPGLMNCSAAMLRPQAKIA